MKSHKHAVAYLRVSGASQVDGDGFPRQRQAVQQAAKRLGLAIVDEYRDEGISGTSDLEGRPGLTALFERLATNGVRVVLVERADRLARDLIVSELLIKQCLELGVTVLDCSGNDLTAADGDPTRVLVRQILAAVAQFDKSTIVSKLSLARARKRRSTGRCEGRKPFGHTEAEQAIMARAAALLERLTVGPRPAYAAVATALNVEGHPTRTGVPWSPAMVRRVLTRNETA